jgi:hypothetical protein
MIKKILLITIWTLGIIFLGVILFGISIMGDRFCKIELRNSRQGNISIKKIKWTGNEWTMIVDSVALTPNEKFEIGNCINCSTLKKSDFDFDAIVLFVDGDKPQLLHRKDMVDYLSKLTRIDCVTFEVR